MKDVLFYLGVFLLAAGLLKIIITILTSWLSGR